MGASQSVSRVDPMRRAVSDGEIRRTPRDAVDPNVHIDTIDSVLARRQALIAVGRLMDDVREAPAPIDDPAKSMRRQRSVVLPKVKKECARCATRKTRCIICETDRAAKNVTAGAKVLTSAAEAYRIGARVGVASDEFVQWVFDLDGSIESRLEADSGIVTIMRLSGATIVSSNSGTSVQMGGRTCTVSDASICMCPFQIRTGSCTADCDVRILQLDDTTRLCNAETWRRVRMLIGHDAEHVADASQRAAVVDAALVLWVAARVKRSSVHLARSKDAHARARARIMRGREFEWRDVFIQ